MGWTKKSLDKRKETIRQKTGRLRSESLRTIIEDVNRTLRGWFGYFKHSNRVTFGSLESFVRQRLRSIERKRHKGQGRARGLDHQRWPNAYLADLGLISLSLSRKQSEPTLCLDH